MDIRSDSKSTVELLQAHQKSDMLLLRICATKKPLVRMTCYSILLDDLERTRSIAGFLLEQRIRKEKNSSSYLNVWLYEGIHFRINISLPNLIKRTNHVKLNGTN